MGEMKADVQLWVYIVLGVIYLISRLVKKPTEKSDFPDYGPENPVPTQKGGKRPSSDASSRPVTFEELLREITEGKNSTREEPVRETARPSYEEVFDSEERSLEGESYEDRDDEIRSKYEEAKRQAFLRPSLEQTSTMKDTEVEYGRFKEFEKKPSPNLLEKYLSDLRDPEGLKKAVVMSEILKRKF